MKAYKGFNKDMPCRASRTMRRKVKDFVWSFFFLAFFVFAGSGMLEAVLLKLMEVLGW